MGNKVDALSKRQGSVVGTRLVEVEVNLKHIFKRLVSINFDCRFGN